MAIQRERIFNAAVDLVGINDVLDHINNLIKNETKGNYILATNMEKVMAIKSDEFLRQAAENASVLIPDGIGVVWAIRMLYGKKIKRIPGIDLFYAICKEAATKGYKIFIYGAEENVNREAVQKLGRLYPGINIVGRCHGYLKADEKENLLTVINESGVDILFVALGSPKQEKWIQQYLKRLNVKICQGIGGTLDIAAGRLKRAPAFYQMLGLEWLYRLIKEPLRLRRQFIIPVFLFKVLKEKIGVFIK